MGRVLTQSEMPDITLEQEFELTAKDFKFIQWFIHKNVGIYLSDQKRAMVYGRMSRKLRELGLTRFVQYREKIEKNHQDKMDFINCITTNKTQFFRERHHFDYLENDLFPQWVEEDKKELRVWSAGCSTGEEPYTFIAALNSSGALDYMDRVSLLATDIDSNVLAKAKLGIYSEEALESIPKPYLKSNFVRGKGEHQGKIKISQHLQSYIKFNQLNLLDEWPMAKKFDVISCRNVMIYFDKSTQERLLHRFHHMLNDGGVLFIGHSESVGSDCDFFRHLGQTIYLKQ